MNYIVKSGDTISKIARDVLGDISMWPQIAATNNITAPYTIFPNQILQLPDIGVSIPPGITPITAPLIRKSPTQITIPYSTGTDFTALLKKYWWVAALAVIALPIIFTAKKR